MKTIMKALADFQKECPALRKDSTAKGVKFSYNYASLPVILEVVNPILQRHGLVFAQPLTESGIKTILFHLESGEALESETNIPRVELAQMNAFQSAGCGITYFRRYALCSLLGIVSDEDTDAAGEQTSTQQSKYPEDDNKPWMTEKQLAQLVDKIRGGDYLDKTADEVLKTAREHFKVNKKHAGEITAEMESDFNKKLNNGNTAENSEPAGF